jgi:flagellin-like hook-associated protein FlgL
MGFRITTNMMVNTYKYNLMNNTNKLADARDKVLTQRNFNSYAEDPTGATKAFRLRRDWYQTNSQLTNTTDTYNKFHTAWTNIQGILKDLENPLAKMASINGTTGTAGESRRALAQVLRETGNSVIQSMNQNIGTHFVFAGDDGLNVPFSWSEDGNTLYYRGVNVNAGKVEKPLAPEPTWLAEEKKAIEDAYKADPDTAPAWSDTDQAWYDYYNHTSDTLPPPADKPQWATDLENKNPTDPKEQEWLEYYKHEKEEPPIAEEPGWAANATDKYGVPEGMPESSTDKIEQGWIDYYNDQKDVIKLKEMSGEQVNLDLGMGMKEDANGKLINGSAFNSALCGINFVDYGVDKDGDPKNLALIMKELADVFDTWDEDRDPQGYNPELAKGSAAGLTSKELEEKAFRLMDKLKRSQENLTEKNVELDARATFLKTNGSRLSDQRLNLNEQVLDLEQVDLAEAITDFAWDQYCYNSALKIGNQLLSQSLIDYMN